MGLVDIVFRQGHLSERALVDAITTGARPLHLDRCDICAERAVRIGRWMDDVKTDAVELADHVFTPERLAAQQQQILRRLEQLDHPARVIAFPAAGRAEAHGLAGRRVAVSWVGVAAAAGLMLGLVGGQITARAGRPPAPAAASVTADATAASESLGPVNAAVLAEPLETLDIPALNALNDMTPRFTQVSVRAVR
jgi:hypothetical protein